MALFSLLNWNLDSYEIDPNPKINSNLHIWVRRSSSFRHSSTCSPHRTREALCGLCRLGHSFEGLQYEVGLVDESVCTDEDIYCPGNREQRTENFRYAFMNA